MKSPFSLPTLGKNFVNSSRKDERHHKSSLEDPHSDTASLIGLYTSSRDPSLFTCSDSEEPLSLNIRYNPEYGYTEFEIPQKTSAIARNQDLVAIFTSASEVPSGSPSGYSMDDVDSFICMEEDPVTTEAEVERRPVGIISVTANIDTAPPPPSTDGTAKCSRASIIATGHQRQPTSAGNRTGDYSQLGAPDSHVPVRTKTLTLSLVGKYRRNSSKVTNSDASRRGMVPADTSENSVTGESSSAVKKEKVKSSSTSMFNMSATSPSHRIAEPLGSCPISNSVSEPKGKKTFFKPLRRSTLPAPSTCQSREQLLD